MNEWLQPCRTPHRMCQQADTTTGSKSDQTSTIWVSGLAKIVGSRGWCSLLGCLACASTPKCIRWGQTDVLGSLNLAWVLPLPYTYAMLFRKSASLRRINA